VSTNNGGRYPRKYHQRDGQTRRVNQPLWKADEENDASRPPTGKTQSLAEALHVRRLLIDRTAVGIAVQPPPIKYAPGRWTYPDVQVRYDDGRIELHEVKDARKKGDPKLLARTADVTRACKEIGKIYRVIFSDECYRQPTRHNVQLILRCKDHPGSKRFLEEARRLVLDRGQTTLGALKDATGINLLSFLSLVCDGHFEIDLREPIADETIVRP